MMQKQIKKIAIRGQRHNTHYILKLCTQYWNKYIVPELVENILVQQFDFNFIDRIYSK